MKSTNYPIDEFAVLAKHSLMYWKIVKTCLEKKWIEVRDIESFATTWLIQYPEEDECSIALLADSGLYLAPIDALEEVEKLSTNEDSLSQIDAERLWLFARLSAIYVSARGDDDKYSDIQDVIDSFENFPDDLYFCYEYRTVPLSDPRSSMSMSEILCRAIHQLRSQLCKYEKV